MSREQKDAVYGELAASVKAMANPARLELLDLLSQAPRTVEELAELTPLSFANTSQHLQVLRAAGLVTRVNEGRRARYHLAGSDVARTVVALRSLAHARREGLAELARSLTGASEGVDRETLRARAEAGEVTLIDVRPEVEFNAGHLPAARSVPLESLEATLDALPRDREVVAYCRGGYCVFARDAVERLRAAGFSARVLEDGVAEWRARGLPVQART